MAVYTPVSDEQLQNFLAKYGMETPEARLTGLKGGIENSNYRLDHPKGTFVLMTLFEGRLGDADFGFYFNLMDSLADKGLPCPRALFSKEGASVVTLCDKPAAILNFLEGREATDITALHCAQIGKALRIMHQSQLADERAPQNGFSLPAWMEIADRIGSGAERF